MKMLIAALTVFSVAKRVVSTTTNSSVRRKALSKYVSALEEDTAKKRYFALFGSVLGLVTTGLWVVIAIDHSQGPGVIVIAALVSVIFAYLVYVYIQLTLDVRWLNRKVQEFSR